MKRILLGSSRSQVWHAILGVAVACLIGFASAPVLAAGPIMVVYVFAADCAPCQIFETQDWPKWQNSPLARQVKFVRTNAPKTTQAYQVRYWPKDARPFHSAIKVPIVPSFILVHNGSVVLVGNGIVGWRNQVLPQLHQVSDADHHRRYGTLAPDRELYESFAALSEQYSACSN